MVPISGNGGGPPGGPGGGYGGGNGGPPNGGNGGHPSSGPNFTGGSGSLAMTPYTVSTTKTKADVFRKAIKPNVDDYDELKYDKQWDWWKNGTSITATLHGTQNVLNPDYLPTTTDDYDWFRQINYFMFNMF